MIELLIIADDFTGALDTGVQFAARGAVTSVVTDPSFDFAGVDDTVQVLVLDAETRHLEPQKAYSIVYQVVGRALEAGVRCIYKKTDSALRGNVGAELTAVLDASGTDRLPFIPAFPQIGRITQNGIQLINGVPVAESVFGRDLFEPVRHSSLVDILGEQSSAPVVVRKAGEAMGDRPGIQVFDAADDSDLTAIGRQLGLSGLRLSAGCAGFGAVLANLLELKGRAPTPPVLHPPLFVACGSINPITRHQLDLAELSGIPRFRLLPEQKLLPEWLESAQCIAAIQNWLETARRVGCCILDSNDPEENPVAAQIFAAERGWDIQQVRVRISNALGQLIKRLLDSGLEATLMCTGGDTLLALMRAVGVAELTPICELAIGVVLTCFVYCGKTYYVISKSGGFGEPELLCRLAERVAGPKEKETLYA